MTGLLSMNVSIGTRSALRFVKKISVRCRLILPFGDKGTWPSITVFTTMSKQIDPLVEQRIRDFVEQRIAYIQSGDRARLDSTYEGLDCRNEYNRNDYDWYLSLIKIGFGTEVQKYEILPTTRDRLLPFWGLVTYSWPIEYIIALTAVSQRRTIWLVRLFDDGPRVVLPSFNGRVGDAIACGEYGARGPTTRKAAKTVFRFEVERFAQELAERIELELNGVKIQLKYDQIRALAIDCFPWFGYLNLCILTGREDFSEEECGKWAMSEWRYQDFPSTPSEHWPYARDLIQQMKKYYDLGPEEERVLRAEAIYRACAKALCNPAVSRGLEFYGFNLASDFEFGVFDPEHPEKGNYCAGLGSKASDGSAKLARTRMRKRGGG